MILTSARCVVWELYVNSQPALTVIGISPPAKNDVVGESDAAYMKEHLYSKLKELGMKGIGDAVRCPPYTRAPKCSMTLSRLL